MQYVMFALCFLCLLMVVASLAGRSTFTRWQNGYRFMKKVNADDPDRLMLMISQCVVYLLVGLLFLLVGLQQGGWLAVTADTLVNIGLTIFLGIVVVVFGSALLTKRQKR